MSDQLLREILDELKSAKQERLDLKSQMNSRFDTLDTKVSTVEQDIKDIKASINRIEENKPQDIVAMLYNISDKVDGKNYDISALNKRLFNVESTIEQIREQRN